MEKVTSDDNRVWEIHLQFDELVNNYPNLTLSQDFPGLWVVRGNLHFRATFETITIEDTFSVRISLPKDYPASPPTIQETGGRIPKDFHTNPDGTLCLGAPLAVRKTFFQNPRLISFVNDQVVPFLFSFCGWQENKKMPFGELRHGGEGLLEYFQEVFGITDFIPVIGLLKILADENYRGHSFCPCGSGIKLRRCHGQQLRDLMPYQSAEQFLKDVEAILHSLSEDDLKKLNRDLLPRKVVEKIGNNSRENKSKEVKSP